MKRTLISKAIVMASLTLATQTNAIGLGDASLNSWLGQPLDVVIPLIDSNDLDEQDILVRQIYGQSARKLNLQDAINNPRYLISTDTDSSGRLWVKAKTRHPVSEPYVSFVLQVEMPGGTINREYTLLMDMPPRYNDSNFSTIQQQVRAQNSSQSINKNTDTTSTGKTERQTPVVSTAAEQATADSSLQSYQVQPGDTLGQIAQHLRPDQMIQLRAIIKALHQNNIQAFEFGDINRIMPGSSLTLPSSAEFAAMPRRKDISPADIQSAPQVQQRVSTAAPIELEEQPIGATDSLYTIVAGDTLSQIAEVLRPNKRIPLNSITQTLIRHNLSQVGASGGRLSIGKQLKVPADSVFYSDANIQAPAGLSSTPTTAASQSNSPVAQVAETQKVLEVSDTPATPIKDQGPAESVSAAFVATRPPRDYSDIERSELIADVERLQNSLNRANIELLSLQTGNQQGLNTDSLFPLINEIMEMQQEQLSITQYLLTLESAEMASATTAAPVAEVTATIAATEPAAISPATDSIAPTKPVPAKASAPAVSSDGNNWLIWLLSGLGLLALTALAFITKQRWTRKEDETYASSADSAPITEEIHPTAALESSVQAVPEVAPQSPSIDTEELEEITLELDDSLIEEVETDSTQEIDTDLSAEENARQDQLFEDLFKLDDDASYNSIESPDESLGIDIEEVSSNEPVPFPPAAMSNVRVFSREPSANCEHNNDYNSELDNQDDNLHNSDEASPASIDSSADLPQIDADEPTYTAFTGGTPKTTASLTSLGDAAELEQQQKDQDLLEKLQSRNLEAQTDKPRFDPGKTDTDMIELDEIFQPDDLDVFSNSDTPHSDAESDTIWQANIYAAYGQHARAQKLLSDGLTETPDSIPLKLALLDIYARSDQHEEFERLCAEIPTEDQAIRSCIAEWREQFNIPVKSAHR